MATLDRFEYGTPKEADYQDALVAVVPPGIKDMDELLQILYDRLNLPGYFGFNWNALSDTLRDFHWVEQHDVFLVHEDVPDLNEYETRTYLEVLDRAVRDWKPGEEHRLVVIFPEQSREKIRQLDQRIHNPPD